MIDLKQIAGTLKYGQFDGTKRKYIISTYIAFTTLFVAGMIALLTVLIIDYVDTTTVTEPTAFVPEIIFCILGFMLLPIIFLFLILRNEKIRKEIKLWLQDAVELGAFCEILLSDHTDTPLLDAIFSLPPSKAKIRVKFKYNGKHYSKDSGYKNKNGEFKNDYQAVWVKYADKSINILYSPKYDEVIVLKNN